MSARIESLAGRRYRLAWDPAAGDRAPVSPESRDQYALIPCRTGEIYRQSETALAWLCTAPRLAARLAQRGPDWLDTFIGCEGEAIFTFPAEHFHDVCALAHPRRRRQVSEVERARLRSIGKAGQARFENASRPLPVPKPRRAGTARRISN